MKTSKIIVQKPSSDAQNEFLNDIMNSIPILTDKYINWNINPIQEQYSNTIIGYDTLGDNSDCKKDELVLDFLGQKVVIPIVVSQYKERTQTGEKIKNITTLNYNYDDNKEAIWEFCINAMVLAKFVLDNLEIPLRGLTPELQNLPDLRNGRIGLPIFGKKLLDILVANPGNSFVTLEQKKLLVAASGSLQLKFANDKYILDSKIAIFKSGLNIIRAKDNKSNIISDVVSNVPLNAIPGNSRRQVVNITEVNPPKDIFSQDVTNSYDGRVVANVYPTTGPAQPTPQPSTAAPKDATPAAQPPKSTTTSSKK